MIPEIGHFALVLAFCLALATYIPPIFSQKNQNIILLSYLQSFFICVGFCALVYSFIQCDFSVQYVAKNAHTGLAWYYRAFAIWGAHEGSLLLWILIQSCWAIYFIRKSRLFPSALKQGTLSILSFFNSIFLFLLLEFSNPFLRWLPSFPKEGQDLNPLLQDPGFMIHPPILYLGTVGFSIPFAITLCSLFLNVKPLQWASFIKPFVLLSWLFLTLGITLGSWWAYYELGWGGFWFWDPVENASFLPWLIGAALIHSLMVTEKKGLFGQWSVLLAFGAFFLSILGTFLVRSGVLTSVHAFSVDPKRGITILLFLTVLMLSSVLVFFKNKTFQNSPLRKITLHFFSFEAAVLLNNALLTLAMVSILVGTLYPLILEVLEIGKISVGPPFFNQIFIPCILPLLIGMGFAPRLRWTQDTFLHHRKTFLLSIMSFITLFIVMKYSFAVRMPFLHWLGFGLGFFVFIQTLLQCSWKKIGMNCAHIGVAFLTMGISLTTVLSEEHDLSLGVGEKAMVGTYQFEFKNIQPISAGNYTGVRAHFVIKNAQGKDYLLFPEKRIFTARNMPMTETAIDPGFFRDLYIALGEPLEEDRWTMRLYVKPFVRWLWIGGVLMALGAFFAQRRLA